MSNRFYANCLIEEVCCCAPYWLRVNIVYLSCVHIWVDAIQFLQIIILKLRSPNLPQVVLAGWRRGATSRRARRCMWETARAPSADLAYRQGASPRARGLLSPQRRLSPKRTMRTRPAKTRRKYFFTNPKQYQYRLIIKHGLIMVLELTAGCQAQRPIIL